MSVLLHIIFANLFLSIASVAGLAVVLRLRKDVVDQQVMFLVAVSAGTLLGGAFLHLLPESAESLPGILPFAITLFSFLGFFILERIIHYRHCHSDSCDEHSMGFINLIGDGVHNFIDGVLIAGAFMTNIPLGVVTTIAVLVHEIPQEIGDLGVLLHAGFSRKRAVLANVAISLTSLIGGVIGFIFADSAQIAAVYLLPVAAGSFLYLASSDLLPEIRKEDHTGRFTISMFGVGLGIAIMAVFTLFE